MKNEMTTPQRQYLSDYKAPQFEVESTTLSFQLHETATVIRAKTIYQQKEKAPLILFGENLKLLDIKLNEKTLSSQDYVLTEETLTLPNPPTRFELDITVEVNPSENKSCEGLYLSSGIFCTQCEAESFRKITYFLDRPDVMTSYTVEIEADEKKYPHLLSNGDCLEKKSLGNGRHKTLWKDPFKKPSYLFALVAGDLGVIKDTFKTRSGKIVQLEVYAPHGKQSRCYHAMESLKKSMKWDEDRFGLEYDLQTYMIVSIDDFNMGAMENKGLNVFNSRLVLADKNTATDHDFDMIESVVGHEYFHNWTGNRVTCRNWFELSLKEGLTVFRDQEFSADMNSRSVQRIKDVDSLRSRQFTEDAGPNAHPVRPESCLAVDNFYTATIYEKGAEVIRMMQTIVGRDGFRKGMDEYFKRHDGQAVTIIDFAKSIAEANQVDFSQFLNWYTQAGTPTVEVSESYNRTSQTFTLTLKQSCELTQQEKAAQFNKKPFHIPLQLGFITKEGQELKALNQLIHLKENSQTWTFNEVPEGAVLSLNRDFSAPVKLKWTRSFSDTLHLIKFDTDAFCRREACSKMLFDEVSRLISVYQASNTSLTLTGKEVNADIIEALGIILKDKALDLQFKALLLSLPNDQQLAQEQNVLDGKAFYWAKTSIVQKFVQQFKSELLSVYSELLNVDNLGARALKNKILGFLIKTEDTVFIELAFKQFSEAQNMTDRISALACLCEVDSPSTETALQKFYHDWHTDSVVFNKWLQVQATSSHPLTFLRVVKASETRGFDSKNPNNLYSLVGGFGNNFLNFHQLQTVSTSLGVVNAYQWFMNELLKIDEVNPQVGARLAQAFNFTKKLPVELMQACQLEIKKALENPRLSKNARELLEKCL